MFRSTIFSTFALGLGLVMQPSMAADLAPASVNVLTWSRMSVSDFGCYMEKTFGYRDKRFNCALKGYKNQGDPCKNTDAYYEGPAFPKALLAKVHPLATDIDLSWEHGELQAIGITLKGEFTERETRQAFKLPASETTPGPENVMSTDIQGRHTGSTIISIQGFDHMGAGDVECDDDKSGS